jgi:ABC-2 type transport system permease protein
MKTRVIYRTNSLALLVIIIGLLGVINYFSYHLFRRLDLTEGRVYTISSSTKEILAGLKDPLIITAYFSKNLPAPLNHSAREVLNILEEYRIYGKGLVTLKRIDPSGDPELEQELRGRGIYDVPFQVRGADEFGIRKGYISMEVQYLDERKVFPNAISIHDLEYTLTTTVLKLSSGKSGGSGGVAKIGFLTGHNEKGPYQELSQLREAIEKQYEITTVETKSGKAVPQDVDALLVAGPDRLAERDKYELDQYLMRGGKLIFLIDGVNVSGQMMFAFPSSDGLDDMLKHYGIKRNHDLVMDVLCERVAMKQGGWQIIQEYPLWVKVNIPSLKALGTAADHPVINQLDSVSLPWCSSLKYEGSTGDVNPVELLRTTNKSWVQTSQFRLRPDEIPPPLPIQDMGEDTRDLAILLSGTFKSFYAEKNIPPISAEDEEDEELEEETARPGRLDESAETSLLVVGNCRFVTNDYLNLGNSNDTFILNALDWMILGGKLIGIRSRQSMDRPFSRETSDARILATGIIGPFAVPLLIIVFGISRFVLKRRKKKLYAEALEIQGE